jgi:hypothetical protein
MVDFSISSLSRDVLSRIIKFILTQSHCHRGTDHAYHYCKFTARLYIVVSVFFCYSSGCVNVVFECGGGGR